MKNFRTFIQTSVERRLCQICQTFWRSFSATQENPKLTLFPSIVECFKWAATTMWTNWTSSHSDLLGSLNCIGVNRDLVHAWHPGFLEQVPKTLGQRGPKYHCQVCLEFFSTKLSLSTHVKMHQRPTCFLCWKIFSSSEELVRIWFVMKFDPLLSGFPFLSFLPPFQDFHTMRGHRTYPSVPQNSPAMSIVDVKEELIDPDEFPDSDLMICTPDEIKPSANDPSTPTTPAIIKRKYRRSGQNSAQSEDTSDVVKRIITRSGRKINFKPRDD